MHKPLHRFKRRFLTLIEMMIVMVIIALLTGVLAYRYTGSLDESRAFKTKTAMEKLSTILNLRVADNPSSAGNIQSEWQNIVTNSPLVANPKDLIYDGWGQPFEVDVEGDIIYVRSKKYEDYIKTHDTMFSNEGHRQ